MKKGYISVFILVFLVTSSVGVISVSVDAADNIDNSEKKNHFQDSLGNSHKFIITNIQAPSEVPQGTEIDVSATIKNTGSAQGSQDITWTLRGVTKTKEDVTIAAGSSKKVTFENIDTIGLQIDRTYTHTVKTENDSMDSELTILPPELPAGDRFADSQQTYWQGQELYFNAGSENASQTYHIRELNGSEAGDITQNFQLNENGTKVIDSDKLDGKYVITDDEGNVLVISNGRIVRETSDAKKAAFEVIVQRLDVEFDVGMVENKGSTKRVLDITDSNRANFNLVISADGLTQDTLLGIFPNSKAVGSSAVMVTDVQEGTKIQADFAGVPTGNYTFATTASDTTAKSLAEIDVKDSIPPFEVTEIRAPDEIPKGEEFDITVTVENTGSEKGRQNIRLSLGFISRTKSSISIKAGSSKVVGFEDIDTADLKVEKNYSITVKTYDKFGTKKLNVIAPKLKKGDKFAESKQTYWQGNQLFLDAGSDDAEKTFQIRKVNGSDVGELVDEFKTDDEGKALIDTNSLDGSYVLTNTEKESPDIFILKNGGIYGETFDAQKAKWEVVSQTLDMEPVESNGEIKGIEVVGTNRANFDLVVSSEELTKDQLLRVFPNSVEDSNSKVRIAKVGQGDQIELDNTAVAGGKYSFEFTPPDTTASDSVELNISGIDKAIEAIANLESDDDKISFGELQKAISYWAQNEKVPNVGEKLDFEDLQRIIKIWAQKQEI